MTTRRDFIKSAALASAGVAVGSNAFSASSYRRILGANDRVRVGIIGFFRSFSQLFGAQFFRTFEGTEF